MKEQEPLCAFLCGLLIGFLLGLVIARFRKERKREAKTGYPVDLSWPPQGKRKAYDIEKDSPEYFHTPYR